MIFSRCRKIGISSIIGSKDFLVSKIIRNGYRCTKYETSKVGVRHFAHVRPSLLHLPELSNGEFPHIVHSQHPDVEKVTGVTLPELLRSRTGQHGNKIIFESETGGKFTYDEILRGSRSFANSLLESGLERGDIVAIALPNVPEYAIALFGIWDAGLIATTVNPSYTQSELEIQMKITNAKCIVTNDSMLESVRSVKNSLQPQIKSIIVVGESRTGCHTFSEMIKNYNSSDKLCFKNPTPTDVALLPFSSGTTGVPKGVMLTHDNICNSMMRTIAPGVFGLSDYNPSSHFQEKYVAALPFFHAFGIIVNVYLPMLKYIHTKCLTKYSFEKFAQMIKEHKPTSLQVVSPMFQRLVKDFNKETMDSIQCIQTAATFMDPTDIAMLSHKSENKIFFQNMFGMTETGLVSTLLRETDKKKIKSIGSLIPGIKAKIVSVDSGEALGPFQQGELWLHGSQNFIGYYQNEKATRETLSDGNWLRTGDVGYYDNEECFYLVDRIKDIIKVKAYQVSPTELENNLKEHPDILDAAVVGVSDKYSGQLPRAYIIPRNKHVSQENIHKFMERRLAPYKQLKGGIEFVDSIPRSAVGKLLRKMYVDAGK